MVVENMKTLGIAQNLSYIYIYIYIYMYIYIYVYIFIFIYIYIIFLTYLYSNSITTLYHSVVSKIYLYSLCLIVCNVSGCVAMVTRNHSTNGAYRRRGHIKTALGIGLRAQPQYVLHMRLFCRFLYCLPFFDTVEFNRLPCPKNEMYDDTGFAIRFRNQLTMFGIRVLIWISRLLHAHIAYEIDTAKIIAAFLRISYCLLDLIRLN